MRRNPYVRREPPSNVQKTQIAPTTWSAILAETRAANRLTIEVCNFVSFGIIFVGLLYCGAWFG